MNKLTWDVTKLPEAIKNSNCWSDVCKFLNRPIAGSSQYTIIKWAKKLNLDYSHFNSSLKRDNAIKNYKFKRLIEN